MIVIFYTTFNIAFLSATIFLAISCYAVFTVQITLWRKQFREKSNLHDNNYHDKATDTLINYETVKYFTAEQFELSRYLESIVEYQKYTRCTLATLHLLNIGQQLIITCCLFTCLYIITVEIYEGRATVGEFVTIQQYVFNLFAPLSFVSSHTRLVSQHCIYWLITSLDQFTMQLYKPGLTWTTSLSCCRNGLI